MYSADEVQENTSTDKNTRILLSEAASPVVISYSLCIDGFQVVPPSLLPWFFLTHTHTSDAEIPVSHTQAEPPLIPYILIITGSQRLPLGCGQPLSGAANVTVTRVIGTSRGFSDPRFTAVLPESDRYHLKPSLACQIPISCLSTPRCSDRGTRADKPGAGWVI